MNLRYYDSIEGKCPGCGHISTGHAVEGDLIAWVCPICNYHGTETEVRG